MKSAGKGTAYKAVTAISEVPQSLAFRFHLGCWSRIHCCFRSSGSYICWVASNIQHARNSEEQQNTSSPFYLSMPGWTASHTATTNRDNSSARPLQRLPHSLVVPPSEQSEASLPLPRGKAHPICGCSPVPDCRL